MNHPTQSPTSVRPSAVQGATFRLAPSKQTPRWALQRTVMSLAVCVAGATLLGCEKKPSAPPTPKTTPLGVAEAAVPTGKAADPSVPPADSVMAPATAVKPDPNAGRANATMSKAQESNAMPLPGQNNDHSAPLTPPKPASSPKP